MNNRGVALIIAYFTVAVLTVLGSAIVMRSVTESTAARRYADSERAFWIAEAGMVQAYYDWLSNPNYTGASASFGGGAYTVSKSASRPEVTVTSSLGSAQRTIQALFVRLARPFENTLSVGGDLSLTGLLARVEVYDKTRISGAFSKSPGTSSWFADKQEGVSQDQTTIRIPDYNNNGTADEFNDFVLFGRDVAQSYPPEEVVYIQTTPGQTVNIFPNRTLIGKKVIVVEGPSSGEGDVNIFFDANWQDDEDLTVISTGTVTYVEPLQFQDNARLSVVAWDDYNEASVFRSQHESVVFAHDDANFVDILDWGSTTGNVIVNDDMALREVLTYEKYYYSNRAINGDLPPGFQLLPGTSSAARLLDWRE
jgi:Tfp pilus assembly protein PilX